MSIYDFDYKTIDLQDDISSVNIKNYYIKFKDQVVIILPSVKSIITKYHSNNFKFRIVDSEYFDHSHQINDFFKSIDLILNSRPIKNKIFNIMSKYVKMSKYFTFLDYNLKPSYNSFTHTVYDDIDHKIEHTKEYSFKIDDKLIIRCINSKGEVKNLDQNYYIPDTKDITYTIRLDGVIVNENEYHGVYRIVSIDYHSDEEPIHKQQYNQEYINSLLEQSKHNSRFTIGYASFD